MLSAIAARKAAKRSTEASLSPPPTRDWSPSRPNDSEGPREIGNAECPARSNFTPVIGQNTFPLTTGDLSSLGFQGEAVLLTVNAGESLALIGVYRVAVLRGGISLCGVALRPSLTQHRVFAPRSSPIPVIYWVSLQNDSSTHIPLPSDVHATLDASIVLIQHENTGVQGLGRACKVFEHVFKPPRDVTTVDIGVPEVHLISHNSKAALPFILPPSWDAALAQMDSTPHSDTDTDLAPVPICIVKGPKKSGKSTFARTLVNRLLNRYRRVAFLECDVGQSEFTPGGLVALNIVEKYIFGPPFTHPTLPYRAHFVGSTTPRTSPSLYISSIQSLLETYKLEMHIPAPSNSPVSDDDRIEDAIPLVVNTMGWTKGLGLDLNTRIEELLEASHVFEIEGSEERGWPAPLPSTQNDGFSPFWTAKDVVHVMLEAITPDATNIHAYTAADHRTLNVLSYFYAVFPPMPSNQSASLYAALSPPISLAQITAERWDITLPLCARYPYEVAFDKAFDRVYLVGAGHEDVVPSELVNVLNGAVVGLVACDPGADETEHELSEQGATAGELPYTQGQAPPRPSSSSCLGLGLIRGVSFLSSSLYLHILTPLPPPILARARVLIKGELELPIWGMLDFREEDGGVAGVERGQVPYLQWGKGEGVGSERRRVRRNLMRKAQM